MAIDVGEYTLVPWHEFQVLRDLDCVRRLIGHELGNHDDEQIERILAELGHGEVVAVRRGHRPRACSGVPRERSTPLRELPPAVPVAPPVQPATVPEPAGPKPWLELRLVTEEGVPLSDVQLEIQDDWGFSSEVTTDGDGRVHVETDVEWTHHVRICQPIALPAVPEHAVPAEGLSIDRDHTAAIELSTGWSHVLVVRRPRATIVAVDGWAEARAVLVFGVMQETPDGPTTVRGALRNVLAIAGSREVHVVGHADTHGSASDNEALALERARSVRLYLSGQREEWAEHAFASADVATLQAALKWAATATGVACDPGPIDNDWGPATAAALTVLREHADVDTSLQLGPHDWAAIFDLYDEDLCRILLTDRDGLAKKRASLRVAAPESAGERWPVDAPELDDNECPANRRVDIVLYAERDRPQEVDELYDATFSRTHVAVRPEATVRLRAITTALAPVGGSRMSVAVGPVSSALIADALGVLEFTALRGDAITVSECTDPWGTSRMLWGALSGLEAAPE